MKRLLLIAAATLLAPAASAQVNRAASPAMASTIARLGGSAAYGSVSDAVRNNPAFLTHPGTRRGITISLAQVGVRVGGDLVQFDSYQSTFASGRVLDAAAVNAAMSEWFGTSLSDHRGVDASFRSSPVVVTWVGARTAVSGFVRGRVFATATMSRGWADLMLTGSGSSETYPLDANAVSMGFAEIGVAVSRRFGRLHVGLAPRLVSGSDAARFQVRSQLTTSAELWAHSYKLDIEGSGLFEQVLRDEEGADVRFELPFGSAGTGFGIDLGVGYELTPRLSVGASITDLGSLSYDGVARRADRSNDPFTFEGLTLDLDRIDNEFGGAVDEYARSVFEELFEEGYDTEPVNETFSLGLPTTLRLGASYRWRYADVHADIASSLYSPIDDYDRGTTVSVGALRRFGPLRLEGALGVGGRGALRAGFGVGLALGPYQLALAVQGSPQTTLAGRGGSVGVGLSLINLSF